MKTILIYTSTDSLSPLFFTLEGDYQHLDNVFINEDADNEKEQKELLDLLIDPDTGLFTKEYTPDFPVGVFCVNNPYDIAVICCGFMD